VAAPGRPEGGVLSRWDRLQLTSLPPGLHPRTRAWARALAAQPGLLHADAQTLVQAVLRHLREDGYAYTLSPGPYEGDAIDEFWMDRKLGFCEHYASAFVVVMRSLGVPARIVTGYQGADPAPVDGYWVVRQSNAHAWAEYWQDGQGWLRADPTAAVAPTASCAARCARPPAWSWARWTA
jgi:transglutaminase-like putative cysteine protease